MVTKDEAAAVATVIPPTELETAIVSPEESQEQKANVNGNQKDENIITTKTPSLDQEVSPVRKGDGTVVDDVKTSEKKERNDRKDRRRRPEPKVVNSRAAALADADADREVRSFQCPFIDILHVAEEVSSFFFAISNIVI